MTTSSVSLKPARRSPKLFGQGLVEFALVLPVLLALIFAIIEIARLLYAWLAVQNAARFAVRYAVTGNFDKKYCADATQFYLTHSISGTTVISGSASAVLTYTMDTYTNPYDTQAVPDPENDCNIPMGVVDYTAKTEVLQDFARLASIHDAAQNGAPAISAAFNDPAISGDYLGYLNNPFGTFHSDYRGNPGELGYFNVFICSNRPTPYTLIDYTVDNPYYYPGHDFEEKYRYPDICTTNNTETTRTYRDDAGAPGNRVRVIITFRHPLITPFLGRDWNSVRLTAVREGIVEAFRTARELSLPAGFGQGVATRTLTPLPTNTPTETYTPLPTNTPTWTATPTETPLPCNNLHSILREYFNNIPTGGTVASLQSDTDYPDVPTGTTWPTTIEGPTGTTGYDNFGERLRGYICVDTTTTVNFFIASDDSSQLWLSTDSSVGNADQIASVSGWTSQYQWDKYPGIGPTFQQSAPVTLAGGVHYYVEVLHANGSGGYNLAVGWNLSGSPQVIGPAYISPYAVTYPTRTPTITRSPTITQTPSKTATPSPTATATADCASFGYSLTGPTLTTNGTVRQAAWTVNSTNPAGRLTNVSFDWFFYDYLSTFYDATPDVVNSFRYNGAALPGGTYSSNSVSPMTWANASSTAAVVSSAAFQVNFTNARTDWADMTAPARGLTAGNFGVTITLDNGCVINGAPATGGATYTPTRTPTRTQTGTNTQTRTPTQSRTPTVSRTPTRTRTRTATVPTPTRTSTRTITLTVPSPTRTETPTHTATVPSPTRTETRTNTPTVPSPTRTNTPTNTPTVPSPTNTRTRTATFTPLPPTDTPTRTATRTATVGPTFTNTATRTQTRTVTVTLTPTLTPFYCTYRTDTKCYVVTGGCSIPPQPPYPPGTACP